jgi:hypothetical protein
MIAGNEQRVGPGFLQQMTENLPGARADVENGAMGAHVELARTNDVSNQRLVQ